MKIDPAHKIGLAGKYNAGVSVCPECGFNTNTAKHSLGVSDAPIGSVLVIQCPECFTKWYFHTRDTEDYNGHYYYFVTYLKRDINYWLNPDMTERI